MIRFDPSQRWAVSGKTGTGKTIFEKWWLQHWYVAGWQIVIIDIKRKFAAEFAARPEDATLLRPFVIDETAAIVPGCPVMIYHPSLPGWSDDKLNRLFLAILAQGHIVLALDEVAGVADESHTPLGLTLIWTQGRQSNIPAIACFQKPVRIPVDLLEQAEWFVVFRINNEDYRKKLVQISGGFEELMERPPLYYYWLVNENWDEPVLMAPIPWESHQEKQQHGAKAVGTPGGGLLDTTDAGRRQTGRKVS